ncbi:MAG: DUF6468 domain-containing protein [Beijerinckiaceae bacterium]
MAFGVSLAIEILVAVLLMATISYCITIDKRLKQLRMDEQTMRKTVTDLATATDNAERAIAGLRQTVAEANSTLAERIDTAERFAADLSINIKAGEDIIERVRQIVETSRKLAAVQATAQNRAGSDEPMIESGNFPEGSANTRLAAAAIAAERLALRARARLRGEAA